MADAFIQVPVDGAGKMVDQTSLTVGINTVHRQRVVIAGGSALALAPVDATLGLAVEPKALPPGAATAALQQGMGVAGAAHANVASVQGVGGMTPLKIDGSGFTIPVSLATAPSLVAGTALIGKVGIDQTTPGTTNKVSVGADVVHVIVDSGAGGTAYTEDLAAAADPIGTAVILVRKDTPAATVSTDGDNIAWRAGNFGNAYVTLVDSSGNFLSVGGGTQYTEDVASAADPIGNMLMMVRRDTLSGSEVSADSDNITGKGTSKGELYVKHSDPIAITAVAHATNNPTKLEDAAHASGDAGAFILAVRQATATDQSVGATDGDYEPLLVGRDGQLWVGGQVSPKGGWTPATGSIGNTKTDLGTANTPTGLGGGWFYNPNGSVAYVQIFNTQASAVTLGTTPPVLSLGVPAGGGGVIPPALAGIIFSAACSFAVTTTRAGSTSPASTVDYNFWFKQ